LKAFPEGAAVLVSDIHSFIVRSRGRFLPVYATRLCHLLGTKRLTIKPDFTNLITDKVTDYFGCSGSNTPILKHGTSVPLMT